MIMTASGDYQSLESFCQKYYKDMEATFKNVSAREEYTENQKLGQLPALKYVFTIGAEASETEPNAVQYKYMQIFALDQRTNQVYIFTYTAVADKYAEHLDDVNRIAAEIYKKGFALSLVRDNLGELFSEIDFKENCLKLALKTKRADRNRLFQYLIRAGHTVSDATYSVMQVYKDPN